MVHLLSSSRQHLTKCEEFPPSWRACMVAVIINQLIYNSLAFTAQQ